MRLVHDDTATRYDGGLSLANGRHYGFRSDHGVCEVDRSMMGDKGQSTDSSTDVMSPDEMIELASAMVRCARAAKNFHEATVAQLRARESDGEA